LPFHELAAKRSDKGDYWWELRACDYYEEFEDPKIVYPDVCMRPEFTLDDGGLYLNKTCFMIPLSDKYLLGVLNSSIMRFLIKCIIPELRGGYYTLGSIYMETMPIPIIDCTNPKDIAYRDQMVSLVGQMLTLHKHLLNVRTPHEQTSLHRQIESTNQLIDALVYQLYGLNEDEINIVESK